MIGARLRGTTPRHDSGTRLAQLDLIFIHVTHFNMSDTFSVAFSVFQTHFREAKPVDGFIDGTKIDGEMVRTF